MNTMITTEKLTIIVLILAMNLLAETILPPMETDEIATCMIEAKKALFSASAEITTEGGINQPETTTLRQTIVYYMKNRFNMEYVDEITWTISPNGKEESNLATEEAYNGEFRTKLYRTMSPMRGSINPDPPPHQFQGRFNFPGRHSLTTANILTDNDKWDIERSENGVHQGVGCYVFVLMPASSRGAVKRPAIRIYICPAHSFNIVRREIFFRTANGDKDPHLITCYYDFEKYADDIWLPRRYESHFEEGWMKISFKYASINQPIPDSRFVVHFPAGTIVDDERTGRFLRSPDTDEQVDAIILELTSGTMQKTKTESESTVPDKNDETYETGNQGEPDREEFSGTYPNKLPDPAPRYYTYKSFALAITIGLFLVVFASRKAKQEK